MIQAFSTSRGQRITLLFLTATLASTIAASAVGLDDHLAGIALGMFAGLTALLSLAHAWRSEKPFRYLLWGSLAAVVPAGILADVLESLARTMPPGSLLRLTVELLGVAFFFVALFGFPPALIVGIVGSLVMARRARRAHRDEPVSKATSHPSMAP